MNRSVIAVLASAAVVLVSGLMGCGRSNLGTIEFGDMCYPPTGVCQFTSPCVATWAAGQLWVDLNQTKTLAFPIQVNNQRPNNLTSGNSSSSSTVSTNVNTNDALITEYDLTYQVSGKNIPAATALTNAQVPAAGSTVTLVTLISPQTAAQAALASLPAGTVVTVTVTARGTYMDGTTFESGGNPIPVILYNGQLSGSWETWYQNQCTTSTVAPQSLCPPNPGQSAVATCG